MNAFRIGLLAAIVALALGTLSSCGSDDDATTQRAAPNQESGEIPAAVVAEANRNCRRMLRDVKRAGRVAARTQYSSTLELATEGFARPGLRLTERLAERQQALEAAADDPRFSIYTGLFDPIIVLGEQGLIAGRAEDPARSAELRDLLIDLGEDQRRAARSAGLQDCSVDFLEALVQGATG